MPCRTMPIRSIQNRLPASPKAKNTYRNAQAAMPIASVILTPRRTSRNGISSRNSTSETWPRDCTAAADCTPISLRNRLVKL